MNIKYSTFMPLVFLVRRVLYGTQTLNQIICIFQIICIQTLCLFSLNNQLKKSTYRWRTLWKRDTCHLLQTIFCCTKIRLIMLTWTWTWTSQLWEMDWRVLLSYWQCCNVKNEGKMGFVLPFILNYKYI